MDHPETLSHRLEIAIARRDEASPFSPEWDAAMSHLDELRVVAREILLARTARKVPLPA
jgi:hypothetical protein